MFERHYKALAIIFALAVAFSMWGLEKRRTHDLTDYAQNLCKTSNLSREELNKRGEVLQEFLRSAAEARQRSADNGTDARQRANDQRTADRYRELAEKVEPVRLSDCRAVEGNPNP